MNHQSLYRKYRPETFDQVRGQDHVVHALQGALAKGNVAHAYLFAGGRGTGKTSVARILAQALGCHPHDIYEIDAASNNSVDDIRELQDTVMTLPFSSPYKVYIIDEVHMLSRGAFNAFLKVLEEPPRHVIFILATTEISKVLETVVSRCQVFEFKSPSQSLIHDMIHDVAVNEGYTITDDAIEVMTILATGSFRDAHGVLQKVLGAVSDQHITRESLEPIFGVPRAELVHDFLRACIDQDAEKIFPLMRTLQEQSINPEIFMMLVIRTTRLILMMRYDKQKSRESYRNELSEHEYNFCLEFVGTKGAIIKSDFLSLLLQSIQDMRFAYQNYIPLEICALRLIEKK